MLFSMLFGHRYVAVVALYISVGLGLLIGLAVREWIMQNLTLWLCLTTLSVVIGILIHFWRTAPINSNEDEIIVN